MEEKKNPKGDFAFAARERRGKGVLIVRSHRGMGITLKVTFDERETPGSREGKGSVPWSRRYLYRRRERGLKRGRITS